MNHPVDQGFRDELLTHFNERYEDSHLHTLTQRWQHAAIAWYQFLVLAPIVLFPLAIFASREYLFEWIYMEFGVLLIYGAGHRLECGTVRTTPHGRRLASDSDARGDDVKPQKRELSSSLKSSLTPQHRKTSWRRRERRYCATTYKQFRS